jgi:hypothetical protein
MRHTKKSRFTNFRKNKRLFSNHVNELLKDLKAKVAHTSLFTASPLITSENRKDVPIFFDWTIKKKGNRTYMFEGNKVISSFEFKNNLLYLLRKSNVVLLTLNSMTNQRYSDGETEIIELWGYKSTLFWNLVIIEKISSQELLDICTESVDGVRGTEPMPNIIYCGPDGKIFGWDLI